MKYLIFLLLIFSFQWHPVFGQKIDAPFGNLYQVSDSIYRSDEPDSIGIVFLKDNHFKSILNLKTKQTDSFLQTGNLNLYHIKMHAERIQKKQVVAALKILRDAPKPLVVHCRHGADRTGLVIALYRIIYQNYTKEQAINELKNGGFGFHQFFFNIPRFIKKIDIQSLKQELEIKSS